jgi:chitinase
MKKILHLLLASVPFAFAHHTPLKARQISKALSSDDSEVVAAAWYPSWLGTTVPPESLSWDKYTSVTFAFAYVFQLTEEHDMTICILRLTTSDPGAVSMDADSTALLPKFVEQAKSHVGLNEHLECGCHPDQCLERQRDDHHWWMDRFPILLVQRGDGG